MDTIAILGAGRVGDTLAAALANTGRHIVAAVRNPEAAEEGWHSPAVTYTHTASAIAAADLVINATPGDTSLERLSAQRDVLEGKVLLDVSNATTRGDDGLPGGLLYPNSSLGEQLQAALPETRVVKALNTMLYSAMTAPGELDSPPTAFISGNDDAAKRLVKTVLGELGWRDEWMLDLGAIETARGTEALALLVPSLLRTIGFAPFAISVAR